MTIALVPGAHAAAQASSGSLPVVTSGINTSGATLLVVSLSTNFNTDLTDLADNYSNTWTELTTYTPSGSNTRTRLYFASPTGAQVGSGHTFTGNPNSNGQYAGIAVSAYSGVLSSGAYDQDSGGIDVANTTCSAAAFTPTNDNELIVSGFIVNPSATGEAIGGGFTKTDYMPEATGVAYAVGMGYLIQTTKTSVAATWTWSTTKQAAVTQAAFIAAAGGGGDLPWAQSCL
jgi:hypothetical protein